MAIRIASKLSAHAVGIRPSAIPVKPETAAGRRAFVTAAQRPCPNRRRTGEVSPTPWKIVSADCAPQPRSREPQAISDKLEDSMNHVTFDDFVRRSATMRDRRSLFGGLSAALLTIGGTPNGLKAKKKGKGNGKGKKKRTKACKKRIKDCRQEVLPQCEPDDPANCDDVVNQCCKKACKSIAKADACLEENFPG
jgi:hypothetical protein